MESFSEVLNLVKDSLKSDISDVAYKCWIAPIEAVKLEGNNAHICVANPFHKDILENQYKNKLEKGFAEILGFPVSIVIQTTESVQAEPLKSESPSVLMDENRDSEELESYNKALDYMENQQNKLNESLKNGNYEYTFDTFIVGSSNNFAYAACKAVAQKNSTPVRI